MPESDDLRAVIEEAEKAATAGDYLAAERLLRDAADRQEASLGPLHPDLANTLNNLAVVYEALDRPADAEGCYRRAFAMVTQAFEPGHPLIATSEQNLRAFCSARGIPIELPPSPAVGPAPALPEEQITSPVGERVGAPAERLVTAQPQERSADTLVRQPVAGARTSRSGAIVVGVLVVAALVAAGLWFGANGTVGSPQSVGSPPTRVESPPKVVPAEPRAADAPVREPPAAPVVEPAPVPPQVTSKSERPIAPAPARTTGRAAAAVADRPTVGDASLCSELSTQEWRCNPPSRPVESGQLFFFTRVKAPTSTTVEHRWYRDGRLQMTVSLPIQANPNSGFRTYSRLAVNAGDWRVELRTNDGTVIHDESFVVR